jgi:hypothetical protein
MQQRLSDEAGIPVKEKEGTLVFGSVPSLLKGGWRMILSALLNISK